MWGALIPISAIVSGIALTALIIYLQFRRRELVHRERMAMIERGLVPPASLERSRAAERGRRAGITLIGFGLGFGIFFVVVGMMMPNAQEAIGFGLALGGMFVLFGIAALLNAALDKRKELAESGTTSSADQA